MGSFRLFIAAYPPPDAATSLLMAVESLAVPSCKPVPIDQVHMTLLFLGDTDERRLDDVIESMNRAASGLPAIELEIVGLMALPERGRARLIAAEAAAPSTLLELQKRLAQRLVRTRPKRDREFLPHVSLARFPGSGVVLEHRTWSFPPTACARFVVDHIRLVASVLRTSGAEHREIAHCGLVRSPVDGEVSGL